MKPLSRGNTVKSPNLPGSSDSYRQRNELQVENLLYDSISVSSIKLPRQVSDCGSHFTRLQDMVAGQWPLLGWWGGSPCGVGPSSTNLSRGAGSAAQDVSCCHSTLHKQALSTRGDGAHSSNRSAWRSALHPAPVRGTVGPPCPACWAAVRSPAHNYSPRAAAPSPQYSSQRALASTTSHPPHHQPCQTTTRMRKNC